MSVHRQDADAGSSNIVARMPRYYAHCPCGVCGPLRLTRAMAGQDDSQHQRVCSSARTAVAA